jgi:hypothetical protein
MIRTISAMMNCSQCATIILNEVSASHQHCKNAPLQSAIHQARLAGAGGVGSIPANSDAQNAPSFCRWRFEMIPDWRRHPVLPSNGEQPLQLALTDRA